MAFVTIFADASFDPETRLAGWGAWMVRDGVYATSGGPILNLPEHSNDAEVWALVYAVAHAEKTGLLAEDITISLQSDCTRALSVLNHGIESAIFSPHPDGAQQLDNVTIRTARETTAIEEIQQILARTRAFALNLRHVKGHSGMRDGRSIVNARCDRLARYHMRLQQLEQRTRQKRFTQRPIQQEI